MKQTKKQPTEPRGKREVDPLEEVMRRWRISRPYQRQMEASRIADSWQHSATNDNDFTKLLRKAVNAAVWATRDEVEIISLEILRMLDGMQMIDEGPAVKVKTERAEH
jgi:hypothetical protein